jgi:hypothetical protein
LLHLKLRVLKLAQQRVLRFPDDFCQVLAEVFEILDRGGATVW